MILNFTRTLALVVFLLFTKNITFAQQYVDVLKANYTNIFNAGYEDSKAKTDVGITNINFLYPIKLNEKTAILSGIDYTNHNLSLFPDSDKTSISNITLKIGLNIKHSDKLSGTYVALPKIASEGLHSNGNDFFFGGLALLKYQKTANFQWRFGAYASSEGFGVLATPILGLHYLSANKKLEVTANLPISLDVNYNVGSVNSLGFGLNTPVKSYSLKPINSQEYYVQVSNIEFGPYFETRFLDNSLLLRIHAGYSTVEYLTYEEGDTLDFRLSAFEFGDRNLIGSEMTGNLFAKAGLIYRFHLDKK